MSLPDVVNSNAHACGHGALGDRDLHTRCVHCGLCLEVCPTYQITGDENNSPRGRLRLWREEAEGKLSPDPWTASYTGDCVGCLACESACPANVPYGEILEQTRHSHVASGRTPIPWKLRWAAALAARPTLFNLLAMPVRCARKAGLLRHRLMFPGRPAVTLSTAQYADRLMSRHRPTGPRVALLTGCLMESVFREVNFATVRVLIQNNVQVVVPTAQGCCGALHEHLGMDEVELLRDNNRTVFGSLGVEAVVANSAGCGLATAKTLRGALPVRDVVEFLEQMPLENRATREPNARVYVDLPCHLVHGQKMATVPTRVLDATGYAWSLAPQARDCCGSGGVYHMQRPENAREILTRKSSFLNEAEGEPVILATSNHVCMMQWHSARATGLVKKPFEVRHLVQLLDPGESFEVRRA